MTNWLCSPPRFEWNERTTHMHTHMSSPHLHVPTPTCQHAYPRNTTTDTRTCTLTCTYMHIPTHTQTHTHTHRRRTALYMYFRCAGRAPGSLGSQLCCVSAWIRLPRQCVLTIYNTNTCCFWSCVRTQRGFLAWGACTSTSEHKAASWYMCVCVCEQRSQKWLIIMIIMIIMIIIMMMILINKQRMLMRIDNSNSNHNNDIMWIYDSLYTCIYIYIYIYVPRLVSPCAEQRTPSLPCAPPSRPSPRRFATQLY